MTGALLRTSSTSFQRLTHTSSIKSILSDHRNNLNPEIRRSVSDTKIFRSGSSRISALVSPSFSSRIAEAEEEIEIIRHESVTPVEDDGFPGGGYGDGRRYGGSDGGRGDRNEVDEYYQRMLETNPGDALILRNYGKYLHEVMKDAVRAEECYGRAILASPGDGELLSLYANLIWETQRDGERAQSYFEQAVRASPDDCSVLASYAHFLWENDEDEDDEMSSTMVS